MEILVVLKILELLVMLAESPGGFHKGSGGSIAARYIDSAFILGLLFFLKIFWVEFVVNFSTR